MVTMNQPELSPTAKKNIEAWLQGNYDEESKAEIRRLQESDIAALNAAFYTNLSFGTGGMRGVMGVGTNRMNKYTIAMTTQGLANYLNKQKSSGGHSIVIGYDSRHQSQFFAQEAARVLAANKIKVYLFNELRPTPMISFTCRHFQASGAIMLTASHNPPEYNGYKVYWDDGAQILPPHDKGIIDEVNAISDIQQVQYADLNDSLIVGLDASIDEEYYRAIDPLQHYPDLNRTRGKKLQVVFSSLHGTSITMGPEAMKRWGFGRVDTVEAQCVPDGSFPTVKLPNPEEAEALSMGIKQMLESNADLVIATDPDADRVGIAVNHKGEGVLMNGNEIACTCLYHICEALTEQDMMPERAGFVKTIVTSELFAAIARTYDAECVDVLTGFKYVAEQIRKWEEEKDGCEYIFGGEESYGYLLGTHARDKDAIVSACLICETALMAKENGKTLIDLLHQVYDEHGIYKESLRSVNFPETQEGKEKMERVMEQMRKTPPKEFLGISIVSVEDYEQGHKIDIKTGRMEKLTLPKSNVLRYWLADGSKVVIRPSGTEPKVKLYAGVSLMEFDDVHSGIEFCQNKAEGLLEALENMMQAG